MGLGVDVRNRIDTFARVATALGPDLVLSFPAEMPDYLDEFGDHDLPGVLLEALLVLRV